MLQINLDIEKVNQNRLFNRKFALGLLSQNSVDYYFIIIYNDDIYLVFNYLSK